MRSSTCSRVNPRSSRSRRIQSPGLPMDDFPPFGAQRRPWPPRCSDTGHTLPDTRRRKTTVGHQAFWGKVNDATSACPRRFAMPEIYCKSRGFCQEIYNLFQKRNKTLVATTLQFSTAPSSRETPLYVLLGLSPGKNLYPTPRTVTINRGWPRFVSTFRRKWATWVSRVRIAQA